MWVATFSVTAVQVGSHEKPVGAEFTPRPHPDGGGAGVPGRFPRTATFPWAAQRQFADLRRRATCQSGAAPPRQRV